MGRVAFRASSQDKTGRLLMFHFAPHSLSLSLSLSLKKKEKKSSSCSPWKKKLTNKNAFNFLSSVLANATMPLKTGTLFLATTVSATKCNASWVVCLYQRLNCIDSFCLYGGSISGGSKALGEADRQGQTIQPSGTPSSHEPFERGTSSYTGPP